MCWDYLFISISHASQFTHVHKNKQTSFTDQPYTKKNPEHTNFQSHRTRARWPRSVNKYAADGQPRADDAVLGKNRYIAQSARQLNEIR